CRRIRTTGGHLQACGRFVIAAGLSRESSDGAWLVGWVTKTSGRGRRKFRRFTRRGGTSPGKASRDPFGWCVPVVAGLRSLRGTLGGDEETLGLARGHHPV